MWLAITRIYLEMGCRGVLLRYYTTTDVDRHQGTISATVQNLELVNPSARLCSSALPRNLEIIYRGNQHMGEASLASD